MSKITLKGNEIHTNGKLPPVEAEAPDFILVDSDLKEVSLEDFGNKLKILNIFPSLDTSVCATAYRTFQQQLGDRQEIALLNISRDLPFAHKRFCDAGGLNKAISLSAFRSEFPAAYGVEIVDGPLKGLCARAVLLLDGQNRVVYQELVPEIAQEPDYSSLEKALRSVH